MMNNSQSRTNLTYNASKSNLHPNKTNDSGYISLKGEEDKSGNKKRLSNKDNKN